MKKTSLFGLFLVIAMSVLPAGCASPVSPELRQEASEKLAFTKVLANPGAYRGVVVIWGGVVVKTVRHQDGSDLYLSETPINLLGRPEGPGHSEGEFIAKTPQVLDPHEYAAGRKVTVAGEVVGQELGTYQDRPYAYPVIRVKELHLWEEARPIRWDWWRIPYYSPYTSAPQQYRQQMPYR